MTGYGRSEGPSSLGSLSVEVRSVNHRFCDISLKLSRRLTSLEGRLRELVKSRFSRGRIEVSVRLDSSDTNGHRLEPDLEMARQYLHALRTLKAKLRLKGEISLDMIAQARDVIVPVEEEVAAETYWEEIKAVIERSLEALKEMRRQEGERLALDLRQRLRSIGDHLEKIQARAPLVIDDYRHRLGQRLRNLLEGTEMDPMRFNQEVVFFAERGDISEELVRMMSHLAQLEQTIDSNEPMGRKLEFLLQEVHREANTVSSKANDEVISQAVVEIKGELEKIREQTQNIE